MLKLKNRQQPKLDESGFLQLPHLTHFPHLPHNGWDLSIYESFLLKLELKTESYKNRLLTPKIVLFSLALLAIAYYLLLASYVYSLTIPATMSLNYSQSSSCSDTAILFPSVYRPTTPDSSYSISLERTFSVAGVPLFAREVCATPRAAPGNNATETARLSLFGTGFLSKEVQLESKLYPSVRSSPNIKQKLSIVDPMTFELSSNDEIFNYYLQSNKKEVTCSKKDSVLECDSSKLELKQSQTYTLELVRVFKDQKIDTPFSATYKTTDAATVVSSSIANSSTIYTKPKKITLTFNKEVISLSGVTLTASKKDIATSSKTDGKQAVISFDEDLPRSTSIELTINNVVGSNSATLSEPYTLSFTTSGGPNIISTNLANHGFGQNQSIQITYDIPIISSQEIINKFTLSHGGKAQAANVSVIGNTVSISPVNSLPWCSSFSVVAPSNTVSIHGVQGGTGGTFSGKTICYTTQVVGYSVNGRQIVAYKFGTGGENIVYVGGTHGNEASSTNILNSWIDVLDKNIGDIPANRSVYVVPNINPDGYLAGSRVNANNIDLNRNFPANNWKKDVIMPGGELNVGGGGSEALSEPESSAVANFVVGLNPKLVLTYHATGGLAISNESGNANSLTQTYANLTGYSGLTNSNITGIFNYDTTGAFSNWLHDKHNTPAILIELLTNSGNEITSHSEAMWAMVAH